MREIIAADPHSFRAIVRRVLERLTSGLARDTRAGAQLESRMAVAFTFPGQGSQSVGMGRELANAYPAARQVFEEIDGALGEPLSRLIWDGPEDALTMTVNAQPALMAVSIAAIRALESEGLTVSATARFVAGHSLGEYSALAAAGALGVGEAAKLLRLRGKAMQEAAPAGKGAMAAIIGLERPEVDLACQEAAHNAICQIANDNGGGQLVISGDRAAVEEAARLCGERGAKRAVMLPVSAPFHSALMAPAAEAMRAALAVTKMRVPVVPVVSNVAVLPSTDPAEIKSRLVEQVTGQVRWRETIEWLGANGVTEVYEIGAGKVLSGLARRINKDLKTVAVSTPADVQAVVAALSA